MENIIIDLKNTLINSVKKNPAEGILLSGGLDSAILAAINPKMKAITVNLKTYGKDISMAHTLVKSLNIEHYQISVDIEESIATIPEVVRILEYFDPAIPNDIVVYFGLKKAKTLGINSIMTGDGSDELFAGYSFMQNLDDLDGYIKRISSSLEFSSNRLGDFFGIKIKQPYISKEIINLALSISKDLKIKEEADCLFGKWILRKAFQGILTEEFLWQDKRPLEYGSGMNNLRAIISSKVSDNEFEQKSRLYPVSFINKEHLYFYEVYKEVIGKIPQTTENINFCPGCHTDSKKELFHCRVCGWTKPLV